MIPKKDYVIPREREMDFVPEIWNSLSETDKETKKWHGVKINHVNNFFINRKCFCIYEKDNVEKVGNYIVNKFLNQPAYFNKIWALHKKFGQEAEKETFVILKKFNSFSLEQELQALSSLKHHWIRFDQVNVLPWFTAAEGLRHEIKQELTAQYRVSEKEIITLWTANTLSLPAKEELNLLQAAIANKRGGNLLKLSQKLSQDFGWIPFGYDGPSFWDEKYYKNKIIGLNKKSAPALQKNIDEINTRVLQTQKNQKAMFSKYKISSNMLRLLDIQQKLYVMTDERKKVQFRIHYAYHQILEQLGKKIAFTIQELKYLETNEVVRMVKTNAFKKYQKVAQTRIQNPIHAYAKNGTIRRLEATSKTGKKLYKFVLDTENATEFSGQAANVVSKNPVMGKARIISNPRLISAMKKGEILVTGMTTPDFVPAMKLAKAIITDEGGITSHAAIVSRELGIPCIIGTKIATQVLKNGDLVEVDANKGTVRKL